VIRGDDASAMDPAVTCCLGAKGKIMTQFYSPRAQSPVVPGLLDLTEFQCPPGRGFRSDDSLAAYQTRLAAAILPAAVTTAMAVTLLTLPLSSVAAQQGNNSTCVSVTKAEYESANRSNAQNRLGYYETTSRWLRRYYWYCSLNQPAGGRKSGIVGKQGVPPDLQPLQGAGDTYAGYPLSDWIKANSQ